jgi:hypothetical protein
MALLRWIILCNIMILMTLQKSDGQRILQIEDPKQVETIRYYEGQKITFRTAETGKEWQTKKIKNILVNENVIVFNNEFLHVDQILSVRETIAARQVVGGILMSFGGAWLVYGGVAIVFGLPNVVARDLLIGGVAIVSGWLISRFARKVYVMGKNGRIRLLDISFPLPPTP